MWGDHTFDKGTSIKLVTADKKGLVTKLFTYLLARTPVVCNEIIFFTTSQPLDLSSKGLFLKSGAAIIAPKSNSNYAVIPY